jgi:hypothetical protein
VLLHVSASLSQLSIFLLPCFLTNYLFALIIRPAIQKDTISHDFQLPKSNSKDTTFDIARPNHRKTTPSPLLDPVIDTDEMISAIILVLITIFRTSQTSQSRKPQPPAHSEPQANLK